LQLSLQSAGPGTFGYTLVHEEDSSETVLCRYT